MQPDQEPDGGNTPIDDDELNGLIPSHISTQTELNQWEARNIESAQEWASKRRPKDVLDVEFLAELHHQMFGQTWKWAGKHRRSDKNISPYAWTQVPILIRELVANTREQIEANENTDQTLDEIALRFHHSLVRIHPWPNGNGRHSRFATDLLLEQLGRPPFTWGGRTNLIAMSKSRSRYIQALKSADHGDFQLLRQFVRS